MKRNSLVYIDDILESINKIEDYIKNMGEDDFYEDSQVQDAVFRRLEIIGEAVKNIPSVIKNKYKNVPWAEITGTRDILIHSYFGVNIEMIWKVIEDDLPSLKEEILQIKKDLEK
mgnify:CR=1 FL=1